MRFGIVILPEHRWPEARERWLRAEEFGFDHAWTHDHLSWRWLRDEPWFGCLPTLAAAAAVTSRIGLGTLVATPEFRHPVPFAKEVMTIDDVSGGRMICGLGAGAGGFDGTVLTGRERPPAERADRFAEFLYLTDLLLRQPVTDHTGRHYGAHGARMIPGCVRRPRVPLAVAAGGRRALRLTAEYADLWITNGTPGRFDALPYREALPLLARQQAALDEACAEVGRDPATLRRLLHTGATVGGVLDSPAAFEDAAGSLAELGFTDLVVNWPREQHPYAGSTAVLEKIAAELARIATALPTDPPR
ncbi:LLM class flavin-dependent oxidoreductase [Streptomyces sp. 1331.2]|uniref:LLM class flavin-dependent oxidoreductase n=1 Tax=Streptomyces sp. 1331.2 TaxID=1938835 RepID=UPI000BCDC2B9|nr:LLM class flavin-dependent oxidoreductase [Streptomyces sp. 1331.2]SOB85231.1 Luciferase-like monooxygenase [Streptomyces sp. 1331.2]